MRARLGQHFLNDRTVLNTVVRALSIQDGDTVIEIGSGNGTLTRLLVGTLTRHPSARLIAIERDRGFIAALRVDPTFRNVEIICGDALTLIPNLVSDNRIPKNRYRVVGNIPYYITGSLLRLLFDVSAPPRAAVLTLQKEVAERLTAAPPRMNLLAAIVQYRFSVEYLCTIPRRAFRPVPEVDSAVVRLLPQEGGTENRAAFSTLAHALFRQPRKTIRNSIRDAGDALPWKTEVVEDALQHASISLSTRAQTLSVPAISAAATALARLPFPKRPSRGSRLWKL